MYRSMFDMFKIPGVDTNCIVSTVGEALAEGFQAVASGVQDGFEAIGNIDVQPVTSAINDGYTAVADSAGIFQ